VDGRVTRSRSRIAVVERARRWWCGGRRAVRDEIAVFPPRRETGRASDRPKDFSAFARNDENAPLDAT